MNESENKDKPTEIDSAGTKIWRNNKGWYHREDGPAIEWADGTKTWCINGLLHREDGPAREWSDGVKEWFIDGKLHREDGPAIEWANGTKYWYLNGELHREGGPAKEGVDGSKEWWINGKRHRLDGPAIEYAGGNKYWYINGKRHREDGPALEHTDGYKEWWMNGLYHRLDGPAKEWADGTKQYYIDGKQYNRPNFVKYLQKNNLPIPDLEDLKKYIPKTITKVENKDKPTKIDYAGNKIWTNKQEQYHREDGPAIEYPDGTKRWYINGQLHRENGPAYEGSNGTKKWLINGKLHRIDGPAIEWADGVKEWWIDGVDYSEEEFDKKVAEIKKANKDKPTEIDLAGTKHWKNDKGRYHREGGPAIEWSDGTKFWYINGQCHRIDGPAIEYAEGTKHWYIEGKKYSEADFNKKVAEMNESENKDKPTEIDSDKNKIWKNNKGQRHREDGPAVEYANGGKEWWVNGKRHREDGPAYEWSDGTKSWWLNGKLHRIDGPAIKWYNGKKEWYINNKLHRIDGPAIEYADGSKSWYLNGQLHREDGPAYEVANNGDKYWYINGELHREDGPAIEWANGNKEYYIDGKNYTRPKFIKYLQEHNLPIPDLKDLKRYISKTIAKVGDKDKPIKIDRYGNKFWKNNKGRYHRVDGPAIEWFDGTKCWYINGKRHREDGPAIEWADGTKHWYLNGRKYLEKTFYKKLAEKPTEIDSYKNKIWKNNKGQYHREDSPAVIWSDGTKHWYLNGKRHREDGPAIEYSNGYKEWYIDGLNYSEEEFNKKVAEMNKSKDKDKPTEIDKYGNKIWKNDKGQYHRVDGPAIEHAVGYKSWWINGKRHRIDGPAREWADGSKEWFIVGKQYSEEEFNKKVSEMNKSENKDQPTEIDFFKNKYWKNNNGELHREDGPAYEGADGSKSWYLNDKLHRIDGPAYEGANGAKGWYIDGLNYSGKEFEKKMAQLKKVENKSISNKEIPTEKTLNIILNAGKHGLELSLAKEPIKIFNNLAISTIKNILTKQNIDSSKLDNPLVEKILELISPIIIHIIFENDIIKTGYNDKIKRVAELAIEYSVTKNMLNYSDAIYNLFKAAIINDEYRNKMATAIKIGMALESSNNDSLQKILFPIDEELAESQKKLEALIA